MILLILNTLLRLLDNQTYLLNFVILNWARNRKIEESLKARVDTNWRYGNSLREAIEEYKNNEGSNKD